MDLHDRLAKLEADFAAWKEEEALRAEARRDAFGLLVAMTGEGDMNLSLALPDGKIDEIIRAGNLFPDIILTAFKNEFDYARDKKPAAYADELRIMLRLVEEHRH